MLHCHEADFNAPSDLDSQNQSQKEIWRWSISNPNFTSEEAEAERSLGSIFVLQMLLSSATNEKIFYVARLPTFLWDLVS